MVPSTAEREAFYRFVENDRVAWSDVIEPHYEASGQRCREAPLVRVAHDTTWFSFEGEREGLGPLAKSSKEGFAGHFSLAIGAEDSRTPLGVLAVSTFVRQHSAIATTKEARAAKREESRLRPREEKDVDGHAAPTRNDIELRRTAAAGREWMVSGACEGRG